MIKDVYEDGVGYVTNEVSSIPTEFANESMKNRYKFVTDLAAISRGKYESNNPEVRFNHLLKECACYDVPVSDMFLNENVDSIKDSKSPSRPLEFLPVILNVTVGKEVVTTTYNGNGSSTIKYKTKLFPYGYIRILDEDFTLGDVTNDLLRYGYLEEVKSNSIYSDIKEYKLYTNFRAVYNFLSKRKREDLIKDIPFSNGSRDYKKFIALRMKLPMFVWAQLMTHTALSKESQSDRVTKQEDYWLPSDLQDRIDDVNPDSCKFKWDSEYKLLDFIKKYHFDSKMKFNRCVINLFLTEYSQEEIQDFLKELGYPREIYSRAPYYFKYKEFVMTGWLNDPNCWAHLLLERGAFPNIHKTWVQKETAEAITAISYMVYKLY